VLLEHGFLTSDFWFLTSDVRPHVTALRADDFIEDSGSRPRQRGAHERHLGFDRAHIKGERPAERTKLAGVATGFLRIAIAARRATLGLATDNGSPPVYGGSVGPPA
jgi:hypothetical protein